jgi:chromosome segregation ATPase
MSESLLFAILGFLVACLVGTVFASFLWRRAVSVTMRRITEDDNFAAIDEVADLKADLRAAQNTLATKDQEIRDAHARVAELETAITDAQATGEGAAENLKRELQNAGEALTAAHADRDAAKAALTAKDAKIAEATERVTVLEGAIRTLAQQTSLFDKEPIQSSADNQAAPVAETAIDEQPDATNTQTAVPGPENTATEPTSSAMQSDSNTIADTPEDRMEPSLAMSRSLEERIEALKQGEQSAT